MVYCGKPSRGCQMCRTRRIKCDETRPTCNQCSKSRRQCPGYMDDFDLMFRNETKATERRAQRANKKALAQKAEKQASSSPSDTSSSFDATRSSARTPDSLVVVSSPVFSLEEQAGCHFVSHFVLMPKDGRMVGHMDFLLPLLKQEGPDSHIQHAFNACALTFLNNRRGVGGRIWDRALTEYSLALAKTNTALQGRETQQSDASLAAVLLLGMFENISAKQISSFMWGSHVHGAVQILQARGKKQVKTKLGKQLFIAVRTLMTVHCLSRSKEPYMGVEWWTDDTVINETPHLIQALTVRTCEIRARIAQLIDTLTKTPENIELMLEVIRKAKAVDQDVAAWQQNYGSAEDWRPKTIAWEDSVTDGDYANAEVFPGRVDVYNDIWIGSVSNQAHTIRLLLHATIVRCAAWVCSPVDYRTTPEYATASAVCRNAITDIIASVPYYMGWHLKRTNAGTTTNISSFACGEEDSVKGLAGYLITWPLSCVLSQDHATDAQRAWALGRLRKIGSDLGVKYALAVSQLQMRIPSMYIRRDAFMNPHPAGIPYGFEKIEAARLAPPRAGHTMNPQQQWEAMQKMRSDRGKAELLEKLTGNAADDGTARVVQRLLQIH